eukprot:CAMPEP_0114607050 /NCGR_PEP_ID=MMETSP0168-20121206/1872_1 /TAXON_ID=95228 ORGANISM="Vannella sp., Strain DIVA3 517/6/12" /NCGR_SAMPLE_ID=MMETSP0168 /ASSEMBLY_ACC=CAM_ASM_000044 /LENGTH=486 /DNA_ID=CAMNT_0001817923 /DNA_START=114 /DNA_END=1571 /DNA_ORIENTATION=-
MSDVRLVGKYYLTKTIGEGSFGKVKIGVHSETKQKYAVKVMKKSMLLEARLVDQIKREIAILKLINHKHVVRLYEVMSSPQKLYMVLELVTGGELFWSLVSAGRFDEDTARKYFQQLIDGVEYCHSLGVYHRDLKPENLLLDADGALKITDFGLSAYTGSGMPNEDEREKAEADKRKHLEAMVDAKVQSHGRLTNIPHLPLTKSIEKLARNKGRYRKAEAHEPHPQAPLSPPRRMLQTKCGTAHYAAPEVLRSKGYDGGPADLWSCGVILYVLLSGDMPFEAELESELHDKICRVELKYPDCFSPEVVEFLKLFFVADPTKRIDVAGIKAHPWFRVGYQEEVQQSIDISNIDIHAKSIIEHLPDEPPATNAFDLINMLGTLDMTRMLRKANYSAKTATRFSSTGTPTAILQRICSVLENQHVGYQLHDKSYTISVTGRGTSGLLCYAISVSQVTKGVYVVDFRRTRGSVLDFWNAFNSVRAQCEDL